MKGTHNSVGIEDSTFTEIRVARQQHCLF